MSETVLRRIQQLEREESLRGRVEDALAAAIISGEMPPGALVSSPTLAAQFNVSATPVREALLNLEKRGFVEPVRNKGFRVTEVSDKQLQEITEIRRLLEPPAMGQLAAVFPDEPVDELRALADAIVDGAERGDLTAYLEADQSFHLRLTAMLGNELLVEVVGDLRGRTRLVGLTAMLRTDQLDQSAREHHDLLDALVAHDRARAEGIMERHIGHTLGWWAGKPE